MMKCHLRTFLFFNLIFFHNFSFVKQVSDAFNIVRSAASFHVSLAYDGLKYGRTFNFNKLLCDKDDNCKVVNGINFNVDKDGTIISLNDNKRVPLVLGTIMQHPDNIEYLRNTLDLKPQDKIYVLSMNKKFERDWAGLTDILEKDKTLSLYKYPTIDFTSPSFIDLLRVVRDLENRDSNDAALCYLHCKAGRGRSVTALVGYIIHLLQLAQVYVSVDAIENYIKEKRPQIALLPKMKITLARFADELKENGNLEKLLKKYEKEIKARDEQVYKEHIYSDH